MPYLNLQTSQFGAKVKLVFVTYIFKINNNDFY